MTESDIKSIYVELGARIKEAREKRGISQEILADQLSLTRASIVNIENGRQRPMIHTIIEICEILETTLSFLLPDEYKAVEAEPMQLVAATSTKDLGEIVSSEIDVDEATKRAILKFLNPDNQEL